MAKLNEIVSFIDEMLDVDKYRDYCPNGLQVEGSLNVQKIVCGVTASQALIDAAVSKNADMILVHHGFFWKGESQPIIGLKKKRIASLIQSDISLLAYHLPLDGHKTIGNNASLVSLLGLKIDRWFGATQPEICVVASFDAPISSQELIELIHEKLERAPLHISKTKDKRISRVAICSGGAQSYFESAIDQNIDAFITGEVSEQSYHLALESGVDFFSAGHHATERYGIQKLGELVSSKFTVDVEYFELENPV